MYNYTNFPVVLLPHIYQDQKQAFLHDLSTIYTHETYSVYTIGEEELYGVSDIDFLIISDNLSAQKEVLLCQKKYTLIDKPLFISKENIDKLSYISHHTNYHHLSGDDVLSGQKRTLSSELALIYARKVLFTGCLRNYYTPYFSKKIPVKQMLRWIYDLRYPIGFLEQVASVPIHTKAFIEEFKVFRNTWFSHTESYKLCGYLGQAIELSRDLIDSIDTLIKSNMPPSNIPTMMYGRYPTVFRSLKTIHDHQLATEKYLTRLRQIDRFLDLPQSCDYRFRPKNFQQEIHEIKSVNQNFFAFGFNTRPIRLLLWCKKVYNFFSLRLFLFYEKT